jgi:DNA polymerase-3 subunit epsilon
MFSLKDIFLQRHTRRQAHVSSEGEGLIKGLDLNTPLDRAGYAVIDTELTGLNISRDSIVSLGAIKMEGQQIILGDFFYRVVQTDTCRAESILIHGITPSESAECPSIEKILPEFMSYCGDRILVGHFVSIDAAFINKEMRRIYMTSLKNPLIDTYRIYQWLWRKRERPDAFHEGISNGKTLIDIAREFDIYISGQHNALYDAFITAQIFQRFIYLLKREGVLTLSDLLHIGEVINERNRISKF